VYAWSEASVVCETLEQRDELALVELVESGEQFGVVLVGDGLGSGEQLEGRGREVHGVGSPVVGVAAATDDESALLQVVDQPDHGVAVDGQGVGELLLGLSVGRGQVAEQSEVTGAQSQRPQALGEPGSTVVAELGDQKCRSVDQWPAG
jgi:hypothetical protein